MHEALFGRFWEKVQVTNECWGWTAAILSNGYGVFGVHGKSTMAHRVAYEMLVGPIPAGTEIDHLCRNRKCVRPDHLEAVTHGENVKRSPIHNNRVKTHCKFGHPFDEKNTRYKGKWRYCRVCNAARVRGYIKRGYYENRKYLWLT